MDQSFEIIDTYFGSTIIKLENEYLVVCNYSGKIRHRGDLNSCREYVENIYKNRDPII